MLKYIRRYKNKNKIENRKNHENIKSFIKTENWQKNI